MKVQHIMTLMALAHFSVGAILSAQEPCAVLQDRDNNLQAMSYALPRGWNGGGSVEWNTDAKLAANVCVRTMALENQHKGLHAHYISSYEAPLRRQTTNATRLAALLEPAVRQLPGFTAVTPQADMPARLTLAPEAVAAHHLGRDRILRHLGGEVEGNVYMLVSTYSAQYKDAATGTTRPASIVCGAVVHERTIRKDGRRRTTASFHDIFIIGGSADETKTDKICAALHSLRASMSKPRINSRWTLAHIRTMAGAIDGMQKVDTAALQRVVPKAEQGMREGLPSVLGTMEALYAAPERG